MSYDSLTPMEIFSIKLIKRNKAKATQTKGNMKFPSSTPPQCQNEHFPFGVKHSKTRWNATQCTSLSPVIHYAYIFHNDKRPSQKYQMLIDTSDQFFMRQNLVPYLTNIGFTKAMIHCNIYSTNYCSFENIQNLNTVQKFFNHWDNNITCPPWSNKGNIIKTCETQGTIMCLGSSLQWGAVF